MTTDYTANVKLRVFISSVQKELEEERMQLRILLSSDTFLLRSTRIVRNRQMEFPNRQIFHPLHSQKP